MGRTATKTGTASLLKITGPALAMLLTLAVAGTAVVQLHQSMRDYRAGGVVMVDGYAVDGR